MVTRTVNRMASDGHVQTLVLLPACEMGTDKLAWKYCVRNKLDVKALSARSI